MGTVAAAEAILAHQGGWDEILMVAAPIIAFALLLRGANRRLSNPSAEVKELLESEEDRTPDQPRGLM